MKTMNKKEAMKSYILAANLLPERLWKAAFTLSEEDRVLAEEFRLRSGKPFSAVISGRQKNICLGNEPIITYPEDIENVIAKTTQCSLHSYTDQIKMGFLTAKGGHRIGLCGKLSYGEKGKNLSDFTSLNIRIAKQFLGIGDRLVPQIAKSGTFESTLIVSKPGIGKTTLLRDICRILSRQYRVCIADCRYELGGTLSGEAVFELGSCDIIQGGHKKEVIEMLLRSMSPEIIALDEITTSEDIDAMVEASYTGCGFIATAHGEDVEEMVKRPVYRNLLNSGIFNKIILLERIGNQRACRIYERSGDNDKIFWSTDDNSFMLSDGDNP
ncbi:MAG: hypothetical protein VB078_10480 [Clostridiaceae bacterium]|nr:hypothetical protein [Clostridiaceae bacterium]